MSGLGKVVMTAEQEALEAQARLLARRREAEERAREEERQAEELLSRLRQDYEVNLARCLVSGRYEAFAIREGRTVGYGWGTSRLEALLSLMGGLGYAVEVHP